VQDLLPQHVLRAVVSQQDVPCDLLNCGHLFADLKSVKPNTLNTWNTNTGWNSKLTPPTCNHRGYTAIASKLQPDDAFLLVSKIFDEFDKLCDKWGVTKIETIGAFALNVLASGPVQKTGALNTDTEPSRLDQAMHIGPQSAWKPGQRPTTCGRS
jgi:class 3 adenylate cyclase